MKRTAGIVSVLLGLAIMGGSAWLLASHTVTITP